MSRLVSNAFLRVYHGSGVWLNNTYYLGVPVLKCPTDLWVYQEIIFSLKPDLIIECGTASGGSALFMASLLDIIGKGEVVTIDIEDSKGKPRHPRIRYIVGSSTSEQIVGQIKPNGKVMVILDSDHHKSHVLNELRLYSGFVTKGSYLIVEDTSIGHPLMKRYGAGPMEAVSEFLKENRGFTIDRSREKFLLSFNPRGYLLKV